MTDPTIDPQATPPAGIPPASANPGLWDLANRITLAVIQVLITAGVTGPMIPPPGGLAPAPAPPPAPPVPTTPGAMG